MYYIIHTLNYTYIKFYLNYTLNLNFKVLVQGLNCGSPLFRHEVAFVLGQIQNKTAINGLIDV